MAFMMKKKKYKFQVELCLMELLAVPFVNGVLFAKVRLLDGGNFRGISTREEVKDHAVRWGAKFEFVCKMSANASTGELDPCVLRVSVRKELKGGRSFQKLGFADRNLAEFAGSGQTTRRCLLDGYDTRHRQDNSMLTVAIRMNMLSGDILFKVPSSSKRKQVTAKEEGYECRDEFFSGSLAGFLASGSSGFGSLSKKRPPFFPSEVVTGPAQNTLDPAYAPDETDEDHEPGHSRNSSNTSQMSKTSGYSSHSSQSQHSRQSSSGGSGHKRNASSGSGLSETGSFDRTKIALKRRKKATEERASQTRVEMTRVNPYSLIDEILRSTNLEAQDESASGLQLFIAKDGTTALGCHELMSRLPAGVFKQVIINPDNWRSEVLV
jgi:hypothetical protein